MKILIFFILIAAVSSFEIPSFEEWTKFNQIQAENLEKQLFNQFKSKYNKLYGSTLEELNRLSIFKSNLQKVSLLNKLDQGTAVYGVNEFSDLTEKEFLARLAGLKPLSIPSVKFSNVPFVNSNVTLPDTFDWRELGAVTEVKNQGQCGSCWAFSTTGNIEGVNKVANGELVSLSEQNLVDCDKTSNGCNGGLMSLAFESIMKMGGIEGESDYPYKGVDGECQFKQDLVKVKINSYTNLTENEDEIAQYLVQNGPVAVALNANMMQFYMKGVAHPLKFFCNPNQLNHGVLIVGFGKEKKYGRDVPYWIIKNSWGKNWGEDGYYRLYRNDGVCGINKMASSAVIQKKEN